MKLTKEDITKGKELLEGMGIKPYALIAHPEDIPEGFLLSWDGILIRGFYNAPKGQGYLVSKEMYDQLSEEYEKWCDFKILKKEGE